LIDRILQTEGHTLAARTYNPDAPGFPVILLHGVVSSLPFWTPDLVAPFQPYGPCTALTLPGHYPGAFPPGFGAQDLTAESMARLLHGAIYQLTGDQPALLVGHSTGGFGGLALAVHYPQSVRGVISLAGFAQGRWGHWLKIYQWLSLREPLGRAAFWALFSLGGIRPFFRVSAAYHTPIPAGQISKPDLDRLIDENLMAFRRFDRRAMQTYFAAMRQIDILPQLSQIRVPVLALCGDADPAVPPSQSARIAAAIPGAEHVLIRGGVGHMPFYQQAGAYRQAVDGWLQKHFGSESAPSPTHV
jgi:pimeloyl-ACP methyl ester carboxylesterase